MSHRKIVVALGGNAILSTDPSAQAQEAALAETARHLVKLIQNGDELIITHGNGPQVGNLLLQHLAANSEKNPAFPLDSLVAMTEGSIGFWLQNALENALQDIHLDKTVVSVVTQVVVDKNDPAFLNPSKPIGPFYSEEEAKAEAERLAEIEQLAKENANAHIKAYDAETGEILEQGTITPKPQNNVREVPKFEPSEPLTIDLRLILHGGKSQFDQLKEWLEDNFISFETLEG